MFTAHDHLNAQTLRQRLAALVEDYSPEDCYTLEGESVDAGETDMGPYCECCAVNVAENSPTPVDISHDGTTEFDYCCPECGTGIAFTPNELWMKMQILFHHNRAYTINPPKLITHPGYLLALHDSIGHLTIVKDWDSLPNFVALCADVLENAETTLENEDKPSIS